MKFRTMLKSKIHKATVTEANVDYEGSITIDQTLMEAADISEGELVQVVDLDNGARLETYAIAGPRDSGVICINGAAARLIHKGEKVIILAYSIMTEDEVEGHIPHIVFVDANNKITSIKARSKSFESC